MVKKVIVITDGDASALKAVQAAAEQVGATAIEKSAGLPTKWQPFEIITEILAAPSDLVLVLADDKGWPQMGRGEKLLLALAEAAQIEIIGVIAVAVNEGQERIRVNYAIDNQGRIINRPVDKNGKVEPVGHIWQEGDTFGILSKLKIPCVIGMGDPGKMHGQDKAKIGAPITTRAVEFIWQRYLAAKS